MKTFKELLIYRKNTNPEKIALLFEDQKFTYKEIFEKSIQYANYLTSIGIKKSEKFGILDFNTLELQFLLLATNLIGAIPVIFNWRFVSTEIDSILQNSKLDIFFYGEEFSEIILNLKTNLKKIKLTEIELESNFILKSNYSPNENDIFVELFTSGTTGLPKSVPLSNKNLLTTIKNLSTELPSFGADSINLITAPYFHIGGVGYSYLNYFISGKAVLHKKFIPEKIAMSIQNEKITNALLVPAMIQAILDLPNIDNFDFSSLKNIQHGGSSISFETLVKAKNKFKCEFTGAYGLTETSGIATLNRFDIQKKAILENDKIKLSSVGKPISEINLKIKNGNLLLNENEIGEVCIKGEAVFNGYSNISISEFDEDGFFHTGDIGKLDENGNLFLLDRKNDMILSKSENIYPIEIERILQTHPKIKEVAVVGLPSEEFGEEVTAFVVLNPNQSLTLEELKEFVKPNLSSYKIPRKLFLIDEIPKNPTGKILRKELRNLNLT